MRARVVVSPGQALHRSVVAAAAVPVLLLLAAVPVATADHVQTAGSTSLVFDHKPGGNEWWVQVAVKGAGASQVTRVDVRDDVSLWTPLTKRSWGDWAGSHHVEPGNLVQFRALLSNGMEVVSCRFEHPSGVEGCNDSTATSGMVAGFKVTGSAESVRVEVKASHDVGEVVLWPLHAQALLFSDGGVWLTQAGDGAWVRTGYVPPGPVWLVTAYTADGQKSAVASDCFTWPNARVVPCPAWGLGWVENVHAGGTEESDRSTICAENHSHGDVVEVRFDGGAYHKLNALEWRDCYTGAPTDGQHFAEFRMTESATGRMQCDETGYFWPPTGEFPNWVTDGPIFAEAKGTTSRVQVNVYDDPTPIAVEVQVGSGAWTPLQFQSSCDWARSMTVPTGSMVKFRAWYPDLSSATSSSMTWPPGTQPPGTFDASFTGVRGNEWWVQANVATNGPAVAKVEVSLDGGAWKPLDKHSWGWAKSYHIPQGTIVQLRATATDGQTDLSSCRQWIPPSGQDAQIVSCTSTPPPPPPGAFDATFSNVKGNEWWAEAVITANEPINAVLLTINCTGEPADMSYRADWGKWVLGNTKIPSGSKVTLTAIGGSGSETSGGYLWPNATQTTGC